MSKELERYNNSPVLPEWARNRTVAFAYSRQLVRSFGRGSATILRRSPGWLARNTGHMIKGIGLLVGFWYNWVSATNLRDAILSRAAHAGYIDHHAEEKRQDRVARRWKGTLFTVFVLLATLTALFFLYGWTPLILALVATIATAEIVGYRYSATEPTTESPLPESPLAMGVPLRQLGESIVEILNEQKVQRASIQKLLVSPGGNGWEGVVYSPSKQLTDEHAKALERALMAPEGSISFAQDPSNAAAQVIRIDLEDPLSEVPKAPHHEANSLSIHEPLPLGIGRGGKTLEVNFLRANVVMVGRTRSGKSSAVWRLIDVFSACRDNVPVGIDLTNGSAFPFWRSAVPRKATTADEAEQLLLDLLSEAQRRVDILAERAENDDDDADENWRPTPQDPQITCIIDEFPVLAENAKLANLVKTLARIGSKAAVTLVLLAQEATRDAFGSTSIRNMMLVKFLLGCSAGDVTMLMGKGSLEQGWRADKLRSAQGADPADAGKTYVSSADHRDPELYRWYRLEGSDIKKLAREREGKLPTIDLATDAVVVPPVYTLLIGAFGHFDIEALPSERIVEYAKTQDEWDDLTTAKLANLVRADGLASKQLGPTQWGSNLRGYKLEDVNRIMNKKY